ncbi:Succinate dehydrogenase assembly factor 2 mitochondrial [Coemansia erecta]|uniref:Succinate dehydrogenase assembly factor 2, mitochondrial n=1 Tax=Coemansia asiatica TaxID=1052880 RepID=A0A9W7XRV8_9FUNG|nr:Succinate dehydrogenase assembly factor 2 mitochondrial [Coemansia asiatica]KAJ2858033.1 Succinate dehydrogenase assembly factor 2 mitochondrial [Coemansia erecta]KAJ2883003.1 Succinate dehydrogenase assembly factor 2 mitochondrial [Coemansia asiatica]
MYCILRQRLLFRLTQLQAGVAQQRVSRYLSTKGNDDISSSEEGIGLQRKVRMGEDIQTMRRRLQYQMRKRGILETDLLLSTFASEHLTALSREELVDLDTLLSNIDWDIFYWATNKTPAPEEVQKMSVFQKLQQHATRRGMGITRMPDLEETK